MAPRPVAKRDRPVAKRHGTEARPAAVVWQPSEFGSIFASTRFGPWLADTHAGRNRDEQDRRNRRGSAAGVRGVSSTGRGDQGEDQIARPTRTRVHAR